MKIRTQFLMAMILFGVMLAIISVSVILTRHQIGLLNEQEEIAHRIERGASELGYLTDDYLLYGESQQRTRCESKFSSLASDLARLNPDVPEQMSIVNHIRENLERWQAVFADVSGTAPGISRDQDLIQVAWSRMAVQNQGIVLSLIHI